MAALSHAHYNSRWSYLCVCVCMCVCECVHHEGSKTNIDIYRQQQTDKLLYSIACFYYREQDQDYYVYVCYWETAFSECKIYYLHFSVIYQRTRAQFSSQVHFACHQWSAPFSFAHTHLKDECIHNRRSKDKCGWGLIPLNLQSLRHCATLTFAFVWRPGAKRKSV